MFSEPEEGSVSLLAVQCGGKKMLNHRGTQVRKRMKEVKYEYTILNE